MAAAIWVYAEVRSGGEVDSTALEILTKARELGEAAAVVLGPGATEAAGILGEHGAKTVYANDDRRRCAAKGLGALPAVYDWTWRRVAA